MTTDVDAAFEAALSADAGRGAPSEIAAPPRQERDPEAPHGRAEDGSPLAPFGVKADGTPRLREPGPGRPKADAPRVTTTAGTPAKTGTAKAAADYTNDLLGLGTAVWLGISSMKGGALGPVRLPDCRPYAAVWKQTLPQMATVWNTAAQQNDQVRSAVEKFTGEGSMTWVIGVAVVSAGFVSSCVELAKAPAEVKASATAANDAALQEYVSRQVAAMGAAA